jgi:hypothetical protein
MAVAAVAHPGRLRTPRWRPVVMPMPLLVRVRAVLDRYRTPAGGQSSTVATAFPRMSSITIPGL